MSQIIDSCTQDTLPQHVKEMYAAASTKKEGIGIIESLLAKKGTRWEVDLTKPMFQERNSRSDKDMNQFRHKGRARLLVEQVTPGGVVASLMFLRLSVS